MKKLSLLLVFVFVVGVMLWLSPKSVTAQSTTQNSPAACIDFLAYADNTVLGNFFIVNNVRFVSLGGMVPFVNVFADMAGNPVHGAQFSNNGLLMKLPASTPTLTIEMGAFSAPNVIVRAFDMTGGLEDIAVVPNDNLLHIVNLAAAVDPIRFVRFTGGGNEGVINEVCN